VKNSYNWVDELPIAITVCDRNGKIVQMNNASVKTFENQGGDALLGMNVLDCHPEPSRTKVQRMLLDHEKNIYTIEKAGVKKIIIQTPWKVDGEFMGLVELSVELPRELPHFIRD
jgi:transcriptional regulator with PAS, ATPase and Fis domain